jgi:tetratricopeptide (TPR) repeat protein
VPIPTKPSADETVQKKDTHYAQVHHQMGLSLYATKNYTEALDSFSKAISIDPTRSESHNEKGVVLYEMEHYEEALKCFTEAFHLNNSFTTAIYNKGNCYKSMKLYVRALECYDKAIDLDTKYVSAYDQKGVTLAKMERYEEAIAEFDKALKLEPNNSTIKTNRENAVKSLMNSEIPTKTVVATQPTKYRAPVRVRIALIIGNGDYEHELSSVTHDVKSIAQSLATVGYKTIIVQNTQTLEDLEKAVDNFCNELFDIADDLESCIFYYIGHGIRSQEINYLIPTKVALTSETDIRKKCLSLNFTLEKISEYSSNKSVPLMFIDASREGYDTSSWRSSTSKKGLADIRAPKRGFLLVSAEPGKIAQETCLESGRNSPSAYAICNSMQRGCDISSFAKSVVLEVSRMTQYSGSFSEDFVL